MLQERETVQDLESSDYFTIIVRYQKVYETRRILDSVDK